MTLFETIKYFFIKKYFSVELLSEYLLSIEKIIFLVKNCQKTRHGCV